MIRRFTFRWAGWAVASVVAGSGLLIFFLVLARGRHLDYGDVPTWFTVIAAVGGIAGVLVQLRMLRGSTEVQVYQGLIQNSSKIDEILIERPMLRPYIYDRVIVSSDRRAEVESLVELAVDMIDGLITQGRYIPKDARTGWEAYENHLLEQPAVIDFLVEGNHIQWYGGLNQKYETVTGANGASKLEKRKHEQRVQGRRFRRVLFATAGKYVQQTQDIQLTMDDLRILISSLAEMVRVEVPGAVEVTAREWAALQAIAPGKTDTSALNHFGEWVVSTVQAGASAGTVPIVNAAVRHMMIEATRIDRHR